jgi:RNA polymerase sigma-70 factor (ECF subfamily)
VARLDGVTVTVAAFDAPGDRITRIWAVRNPEKLWPWTGVSPAGAETTLT